MKKISIYSILLFVVILSSCGKSIPSDNIIGVTEYYESFLGYNYEPEIMTQKLELDFNEDAQHYLTSNIFLEVVEKDKEGNINSLGEGIKVYQNGEFKENNIIVVSSKDKITDIGIEFTAEAQEGFYNLYLREYGKKQLDEIDLIDIEDKMYVKKEIIYNPLGKGLTIGTIIFVIFVVFWYVLSRFIMWPSTPFGKIYIDYNDGLGDNVVRMNGKYELILTNDRKMKDSFFAKLFKGSRQYEYNDFWTHPITIKKGYRRGTISVIGLKTFSIEGEKVVREPFTITNENGENVKIETS